MIPSRYRLLATYLVAAVFFASGCRKETVPSSPPPGDPVQQSTPREPVHPHWGSLSVTPADLLPRHPADLALQQRLVGTFGPGSWQILSDTGEQGRRWVLALRRDSLDTSAQAAQVVVTVFDGQDSLIDTASACRYSLADPWASCLVARYNGRWEFVDQEVEFRDEIEGVTDSGYLAELRQVRTRRLVLGPDTRGALLRDLDTTWTSDGFPDRVVANDALGFTSDAAVYIAGCRDQADGTMSQGARGNALVPTVPDDSEKEDSLGYLTAGKRFFWTGYRLHAMVAIDCGGPLRLVVQAAPGVRLDSLVVERKLAWHFNDDGSGGFWRLEDVSQGLPAVVRRVGVALGASGVVMDLPAPASAPTPQMIQALLARMDGEGWSRLEAPTARGPQIWSFRRKWGDGHSYLVRSASVEPSEFDITVIGRSSPPYDGDDVVLSHIWGTEEYGD